MTDRLNAFLSKGLLFWLLCACPEASAAARPEERLEPAAAASAAPAGSESDWEFLTNRDRDALLPAEERSRRPVLGGVVDLHNFADPATLNNLTRSDGIGENICFFLCPPLIMLDPDTLELVPMLAADLPELSEDGKVQTWKLKEGIRWDDYETSRALVTTKDIRRSFELLKNPQAGCPACSDFENLMDIEPLDALTFRAVFDRPCADAVYKLGYKFRIVPAHLLEDVPAAELPRHPMGRSPVGYGLFTFRHWKPSDELLLVRSDLNRDRFPKKYRPFVDGIRWRTLPNLELAWKMALSGELDLFTIDADQWRHETEKESFTNVATRHFYYLPWWNYIAWNNRCPLFHDARARRAMTHMTRREEVLSTHVHGMEIGRASCRERV